MNHPHMATSPARSEQIEVILHGKPYKVCTKGQMNFLIMYQRESVIKPELAAKKIEITDAKVEEEISKWRENCGYADIDWLLDRMPPHERQRWKDAYRFGGSVRKLGKEE